MDPQVQQLFETTGVRSLICPRCGAPAAVEWHSTMISTSGPVEHVKLRCLDRHWFLMPESELAFRP